MNWFWRRMSGREAPLRKEITFHIEERVADLQRSGLSEEEARRVVRLEFGGVGQVEDYCRDVRPMQWLEMLWHDAVIASRSYWKSPNFAWTAVVTLTIGIGVNTAVFSLISFSLLRPLPYPQADRIVQFWFTTPGGRSLTLSIPQVRAIASQADVFEKVAAYDFGGPGVSISHDGQLEEVAAIHVAESYFQILGAPIERGRVFDASEDKPQGGRVVVLSDQLWHRDFGAEANIVGKSILLGGESFTVVGVLSATFRADPPAQLWLPLQEDVNGTSQAAYVRALGRLRPGTSIQAANGKLRMAFKAFLRRYPLFNSTAGFEARPLSETATGDIRTALMVLLVMVGFVLLIACSNIAHLLLARSTARQHEMALRSALGGSRARLIGQMLAECGLLAGLGGILGYTAGRLCLKLLLTLNPIVVPWGGEFSARRIDWRVLLFTVGVTVGATILCGLLPAFRISNSSLMANIKRGGAGTGMSRSAIRAGSVLVLVEVALAVMSVTGAGLMIRTYAALHHVPTGLRTSNILTLQMSLQGSKFRDTSAVTRLVKAGVNRLRATPGVIEAASTWTLPVEAAFGSSFLIEGRHAGNEQLHPALMRPVSSDYARVFGIPVKEGRFFADGDTARSQSVCVISEAMAKKYWPHSNPIGEQITVDKYLGPAFAAPPREIIGIAGDVRDEGLNQNPMPMVYVPQSQAPDGMTSIDAGILPITWVVRTAVEPYSVVNEVERQLEIASGGLAAGRPRSMSDVIKESTIRTDFTAILLAAFSFIALTLAAVGIYGLVSFAVGQRVRELGIRAALGATPGQLRRLILRQFLAVTGAGIVIGWLGSAALADYMKSLLYGVEPLDAVSLALSCALLTLVAVVAALLPARRAARLRPAEILRSL